MGLCETSNFSIFTFSSASDLKVCTRSYSNCFCLTMRLYGLNGKVCKMMTSHFGTQFSILSICHMSRIYYISVIFSIFPTTVAYLLKLAMLMFQLQRVAPPPLPPMHNS